MAGKGDYSERPALLLTGASGFVGERLLERYRQGDLELLPKGTHVHAVARRTPRGWPQPHVDFHRVDLVDQDAVERLVIGLNPAPTWVLHLAGMADPRRAARVPRQAKAANAESTRNLLVALAGRGLPTRFVLASTAAVYGKQAVDRGKDGLIAESSPARSRTAYGWSKRIAERFTQVFAAPGNAAHIQAMIARPYNHCGPGQGPGYVVPDLVASIRASQASGEPVRTGSLWPERDFLHVDDVIDAYLLLLAQGQAGRTYDIARGEAWPVQRIFDGLVERLGPIPGQEVDAAKERAGEVPRIVGDASSLRELGWAPEHGLERILDDAVGSA